MKPNKVILMLLFIPCSLNSMSQLCLGSLGDPVINITFGTGVGNSGYTAPAGYTYTPSSCPNDGFYTITNSTTGCFGSNWHSVFNDHTGNGAFLLVNASYEPSNFFEGTVNGLCPSTTYEFSAWILNVLIPATGIQPNLTFVIESTTGTILNSYTTGNIPVSGQPTWLPFGFNFTTGSNQNAVVLRIRNNAPGGAGNDLALDDITFRPCGPKITTTIQGTTDTVNVCVYEQAPAYTINATASPGFISPVYQWQVSTDSGFTWNDIPGARSLNYVRLNTSPGNFWYRLASAESANATIPGCSIHSNIVAINVHPRPAVSAGPDKIIITGKTTMLAGTAPAGSSYNWTPPGNLSDVSILNPVASPQQDTWYTLNTISREGCINSDQVLVRIVNGIYIPNAFTPNNDGLNDNWHIPYLEPSWNAEVRVFNRYGQIVYSTTGRVDWNGKYNGHLQPSGSYIYLIKFPDGSPAMKGLLHLIR